MTVVKNCFETGGKEAEVKRKGKEKLTAEEKADLFSRAMEILTCGDKEIVDAFAARVEALVKMVRSEKKKPAIKR